MEPDSSYSPKFKTAVLITYLSLILMIFVLSMMQDSRGDEPNVIHVWFDEKPGVAIPDLKSNYPISSTKGSNEKEGSNPSNVNEILYEPETQNSNHYKAVDNEISYDEYGPEKQDFNHSHAVDNDNSYDEYEPAKQNSNHAKAIDNEISYEEISVSLNHSESVTVGVELKRVQFAREGRCVDVSRDGSLIVSFCDPTRKQAFIFLDGILKIPSSLPQLKSASGQCVGLLAPERSQLGLVDCTQAVTFTFSAGKLHHERNSSTKWLCLAPLDGVRVTRSPKLGTPVAFANCRSSASDINLLSEAAFLRDRAALLLPFDKGSDCNFPACGANTRPPMARLFPESEVSRCTNLSECLTVVVKVARRPLLVVRLAEPIRSVLQQDLPMIVVDDGPRPHPPEGLPTVAPKRIQFTHINRVPNQ